ncbi:MAG: NAD(P)H-hydrate epimerase [Haloarculaceae archaeon]
MNRHGFRTEAGDPVTAVTAAEMRDVDRVAVEEFGLSLLGMMENAGRNLAWHVREMRSGPVVVLAGNGGNGGGGLCAARHLANRDVPVSVVLDRDPERLDGAARTQSEILAAMDLPVTVGVETPAEWDPETVVDALVGYGLDGALRGSAAGLVDAVTGSRAQVVSLDVPSGMVATTGERPGTAIEPDRVVTLALPKTGLADTRCDLYLADIGIPAGVYHALDIPYSNPFDDGDWTPLTRPET